MTACTRIQKPAIAVTPRKPPLPAEFSTTILAHYCPCPDELLQSADSTSITPTGINIYCPPTPIASYQRLLSEELTLYSTARGPLRPIAELRLAGSPLRQFSAEAITELTFRLRNQLEFTNRKTSLRNATLNLSESSRGNIALLAGLGYNSITLRVDATVASADHSLSRIEASIGAFTEFDNFQFTVELLFGDDTDRGFLTRFIALITSSRCQQLEVQCPGLRKPTASERIQRASDTFLHLYHTMGLQKWRVYGNHIFLPTEPADSQAGPQVDRQTGVHNIQYTPWGLRSSRIKRWIGLGIGALGQEGGGYYRNVSSVIKYRRAIRNRQLPVDTRLILPENSYPVATALQAFFCHHRVANAPSSLMPVIDALVQRHWATARQNEVQLTQSGILHLPMVAQKIFSSVE